MKKLLTILMCLVTAVLFAAPGTIHLLYNNGQLTESEGNMYYEFDIQAYLSEGTEVLGSGMAYVEYPTAVFGDLAITNDIVNVTKTGILSGNIPDIAIYLYDVFENDTYADVFAITFESVAGDPSLKSFYSAISNDPLLPSDMLHISMKVANYGSGNVLFPPYIPSIDYLYYNYEIENFAGGLDISEAIEPVVYEEPVPQDPVGYVEYRSFNVDWKKDYVASKWMVSDEIDIAGYVLKRSENGGEPVVIASYETDPSLIALNIAGPHWYTYDDLPVIPGNDYAYIVEAIDIVGYAFPYGPAGTSDEAIAAYPNPFNPDFIVPFVLSSTQDVNIKLYDMTGRIVKNIASGQHNMGRYEYRVNCEDLTSGVYLLRTVINDNATTQKMLLVK